MQFLTYIAIRSNILTRDSLPRVKSAFVIISREESHRGSSHNSNSPKSYGQTNAFVAKTFNNNNNKWTGNEDKRFETKGVQILTLIAKNVV